MPEHVDEHVINELLESSFQHNLTAAEVDPVQEAQKSGTGDPKRSTMIIEPWRQSATRNHQLDNTQTSLNHIPFRNA